MIVARQSMYFNTIARQEYNIYGELSCIFDCTDMGKQVAPLAKFLSDSRVNNTFPHALAV